MSEEIKYILANTIPSIPDQRDIPYRSPYKPEDLPSSVDMREDVYEIENQGPIGSCVANGESFRRSRTLYARCLPCSLQTRNAYRRILSL